MTSVADHGEPSIFPMPIGNVCILWVNDTPDERIGNGTDPAAFHGHVYRHRGMPVQVSFTAEDGTCIRASFNPKTGAVDLQDITDAQPGAET